MDLPVWLSPLWYVVALAVIGPMLYYYFGGARQRLLEQFADDRDPVRRWAQGVFGIISGGSDYAYGDKGHLRAGLSEWWGIDDAAQFQARYSALRAEQPQSKPEAAWCWVRAVNLTRMAAGAQFISNDESWRLIAAILPRIQGSFAGWEDLGQSYLAARDVWLHERNVDRQNIESVEDSIKALREDVWREVSFNQPLNFAQKKEREYAWADEFRVFLSIATVAIDWAIRFRVVLLIVVFVIAAVLVWGQSYLSAASAEKDLIGAWAGEMVESGSMDDKRYDTRRWLMVVRPDGTGSQTMRWYLGRQKQEEAVEQFEWTLGYEWSVKDLVWRLACKEITSGYQCEKKAYRISIDQGEMRYASGRSRFTMRKVSADYRLP
jgi:Protein of unknown function (DUF1266)